MNKWKKNVEDKLYVVAMKKLGERKKKRKERERDSPYVPKRSPVSEYHTVGLWSFAAVNIRSPSRLYFTVVIERSWPFNRMGCCKNKERERKERKMREK
jgi:hypothetical protein